MHRGSMRTMQGSFSLFSPIFPLDGRRRGNALLPKFDPRGSCSPQSTQSDGEGVEMPYCPSLTPGVPRGSMFSPIHPIGRRGRSPYRRSLTPGVCKSDPRGSQGFMFSPIHPIGRRGREMPYCPSLTPGVVTPGVA